MLPFDTISDDDIEIFADHLRRSADKEKATLIKIHMNYGAVNYHWSHANLREGIKTGYEGALKAIEEYEQQKTKPARLKKARTPVIDLQASKKTRRGARWR